MGWCVVCTTSAASLVASGAIVVWLLTCFCLACLLLLLSKSLFIELCLDFKLVSFFLPISCSARFEIELVFLAGLVAVVGFFGASVTNEVGASDWDGEENPEENPEEEELVVEIDLEHLLAKFLVSKSFLLASKGWFVRLWIYIKLQCFKIEESWAHIFLPQNMWENYVIYA